MQRSILIIVFLFVTNFLFSQVEVGSLFFGASSSGLGFSSTKSVAKPKDGFDYDFALQNKFNLNVKTGWFFTDGLLVGFGIPLDYTKTTFDLEETVERKIAFSFDPFVRYYFRKDVVYNIFAEAGCGIGSETIKTTSPVIGQFKLRNNTYNYNLNAGLSIFILVDVSVDVIFGYSHTTFKDKNTDDFKVAKSGFSTGLGFSIFI